MPSPIVANTLYFKRGFSSGSSIYYLNSIFYSSLLEGIGGRSLKGLEEGGGS